MAPQLGHLPPALESKPEQYADLDYVYSAFNLLTRGRKPGDPIRVSDIISYGQAMQVSDIEDFIAMIQAADEVYLNHGHTPRDSN